MTTDVEATVREVMGLLFPPAELHVGNIKRADTPSWDSLKHVELVFAVEDACQVSLESSDLGELDSLDGIVTAVRMRLRSPAEG
ncbi:acyl carrier protein [Blastococcus litoris]|uniref:acyl carrier protein n=1 Tax=Blastococcus litoris TaxID=2171622 RepID=UPI000E30AB87|nr:acyl carrier protein [Blastococcus litoris]